MCLIIMLRGSITKLKCKIENLTLLEYLSSKIYRFCKYYVEYAVEIVDQLYIL